VRSVASRARTMARPSAPREIAAGRTSRWKAPRAGGGDLLFAEHSPTPGSRRVRSSPPCLERHGGHVFAKRLCPQKRGFEDVKIERGVVPDRGAWLVGCLPHRARLVGDDERCRVSVRSARVSMRLGFLRKSHGPIVTGTSWPSAPPATSLCLSFSGAIRWSKARAAPLEQTVSGRRPERRSGSVED